MKKKHIIRNLAFIIIMAGFSACDDGMYVLLEENSVVTEEYSTDNYSIDIQLSPTGPRRVTSEINWSYNPSLTWTGSEFGIAWEDLRNGAVTEIYFARIDTGGNKIGTTDEQISESPDNSSNPSLVWTGTEYGVSWDDYRDGNREIYFARIDSSGNKIGSDMPITTDDNFSSQYPSMVWTGTEYGVSWQDNRNANYEIYFARIDSSGNKIGSDVRITSAINDSRYPSLVWTGTEYGVSWQDYRDANYEIYFARIDSSGTKIGSDIPITTDDNFNSQSPSLVWTGTEYGVSWQDGRSTKYEIYFARIDSGGNMIGSDVKISNGTGNSYYPSLTWTGTEYGVCWEDDRNTNRDLYFARINPDGTKIGTGDDQITSDGNNSWDPSLIWAGTKYEVSWYDNRDSSQIEIYFEIF